MADNGWHLDRRVPIALIVTLVLQSGTAIWWASSMNARMNGVEGDVQKIEYTSSKHDDGISGNREKAGVILEQIRSTKEAVNRLRVDVRENNQLLRSIVRTKQ